jgi:hypothetical protein
LSNYGRFLEKQFACYGKTKFPIPNWKREVIDLNGRIQPVLKEDKMILGCAIPSHDGRGLALWEARGTANVWMVQRF